MSAPTVHFLHTNDTNPEHDLSVPLAVVIPGVNEITRRPEFLLSAVGGLTKLEAAAVQIAGHLAGKLSEPSKSFGEQSLDDMAVAACNLAEAVLAECYDRQRASQRVDSPDDAQVEPPSNGRIVLP